METMPTPTPIQEVSNAVSMLLVPTMMFMYLFVNNINNTRALIILLIASLHAPVSATYHFRCALRADKDRVGNLWHRCDQTMNHIVCAVLTIVLSHSYIYATWCTMNKCSTKGKASVPDELVGCSKFEEHFNEKQVNETQREKSARRLNELASLPDPPNNSENKVLYDIWNNIRNGRTSVPKQHPIRSVPWTGGEARWKEIDAANAAYKEKEKKKWADSKKKAN